MNPPPKRLYRNKPEGKIAGICSGIGDYLEIDPTFIRIILFFGTIVTGFVLLIPIYIVLIWIIPAVSPEELEANYAAPATRNDKGPFQ